MSRKPINVKKARGRNGVGWTGRMGADWSRTQLQTKTQLPWSTILLVRPIITAQSQCGKGVLTAESEVLEYPDIPDTAHDFRTLLQFGTTSKLMEFLATQQIKVSQRMAEGHAEQ